MEKPKSVALARARGAERLSRAVSELPLRYAPFYARLAQLWQLPEERVVEELTRARDSGSWSATPFRGVRTFTVETCEPHPGQRSRLLSFAPGVRFPRHRHRGPEQVLVLEGCYIDSSGTQVGPGQGQLMPEESEHELLVPGPRPCIAAVVEHGIDFSSPWLRWASKLLVGR